MKQMHPGKVLIIEENSWVPPDRRVWSIATTLRDAGWQVSVICPTPKRTHAGADSLGVADLNRVENLEGITVYRFPLTFAERGILDYLLEYIVAFVSITRLSWRVWRTDHFDILHICNPPDIFFPLGLFYRLLGVHFVFDHHDLFTESVAWRFKGISKAILYYASRIAEFLTYRSANVVIATNETYRRIAINRGSLSPSQVVIVRNGPKISQFTPTTPDPTLKYGFKYMVCYVGVMADEDGVLEMADIIRHVVIDLRRVNILFVLLRDGASRKEVIKRIRKSGLDPYVAMPGMIRDDLLLRRYMSTADVFVSPEPFTPMNSCSTFMKIAEYMIMAKPIIAFDLPETRFTAQESAVYVPPGDFAAFGKTIVELLDDPYRRSQMGAIGHERIVNELGWEHQCQNLFRAYAVAQM